MHVHILGIGGTFMVGVATLAKSLGYTVTGQDKALYSPTKELLENLQITVHQGFDASPLLENQPDTIIVGNAMSRGMPVVEHLLNHPIPCYSGPEWLYHHVLHKKHVLAVAGTHGKTTTSSLLAWVLHYAKLNPGFLIGGVPTNFGVSAKNTESEYFVIEADEYDSAFFDKRAKFVHYHPKTLILNNCEYDHADIYDNLNAIKKQFHHLIRIIPSKGDLFYPPDDGHINDILAMGCWTPKHTVTGKNADWQARELKAGGSQFRVFYQNECIGDVTWDLWGEHNVHNALMCIAASQRVGVEPAVAIKALSEFKSVARRMQFLGEAKGVRVFEDFAHHPTAIRLTLEGLKKRFPNDSIKVILDPDSYTMRQGVHENTLLPSLKAASMAWVKCPAAWPDLAKLIHCTKLPIKSFVEPARLLHEVKQSVKAGDVLVMMSNGAFSGVRGKLLNTLQEA